MRANFEILAIDDDKLSRKIIAKTLEENGLQTRLAKDGASGISQVHEKKPDIILLDVEMPGMNGYEVCEKLRQTQENRDIPIVFLSSHSSLRERMQGYEVGAGDHIVKPFEPEHLIARIKVLLKYREQRRELQAQYEVAKKTAMLAMTGNSELAVGMQFLERGYIYTT